MIKRLGVPGLRIAHVMVTANFAGVERYVTQTATELARRGHHVCVIGGSPTLVPSVLPASVPWHAGSTLRGALAALRGCGEVDVLHVHMTKAELVGLLASSRSGRGALVSTRHFARKRGSSSLGRAFSVWFNRRVTCQIAISEFVAAHIETAPDVVLALGTPVSESGYAATSRRVLMIQRLEREKHTLSGLRAWARSGLQEEGWTLEVLGDGSQRQHLEEWARDRGLSSIEFHGWAPDVLARLSSAAMVLAPAAAEPFGLSVVEAMAAGVPVLAARAGGHLETIGAVPEMPSFEPGDVREAATVLASLASDPERRRRLSETVRNHQRSRLTVEQHVDGLENVYHRAVRSLPGLTPASGV